MNCEDFNDRLPEYLDKTLSTAEQADAREHVQKCGLCRQAVERRDAFAKFMQRSFQREVQGLTLSAKARESICDALTQHELRPTPRWEKLQAFFEVPWRKPVWAGLAFCLLLLLVGSRFHGQSTKRSTVQAVAGETGDTYVIDVPIESETYLYRRKNGRVIDAVVPEVGVINASFSGNSAPASSLKERVN